MMDKDIFNDIYNEFLGIQREMEKTSKQIEILQSKRETYIEMETTLRCLLLDYGDIKHEHYVPKYECRLEEQP